jgi:hypothetical protein
MNSQEKFHNAIKDNNTEMVLSYLQGDFNVDISFDENEPLMIAAQYADFNLFTFLFEHHSVIPSECFHDILGLVAIKGRTRFIEYLLKDKRIKPEENDSWALRMAATHNQIDSLKILLKDKRSNPTCFVNVTLNTVLSNEYWDIIDLLWQDLRVVNSVNDEIKEVVKRHQLTTKLNDF